MENYRVSITFTMRNAHCKAIKQQLIHTNGLLMHHEYNTTKLKNEVPLNENYTLFVARHVVKGILDGKAPTSSLVLQVIIDTIKTILRERKVKHIWLVKSGDFPPIGSTVILSLYCSGDTRLVYIK
jgi:predicted PP-loop superfamily ATPase